MKIAIWAVVGVVIGLWTAGAFVVAEATQWAARHVASGAAQDLGRVAAQWPAPAWLAFWVDPQWIASIQATALWTLDALSDAVPFVESALGWLVPLVWALWALGTIVLIALAGLGHWLAGCAAAALRKGPQGARA